MHVTQTFLALILLYFQHSDAACNGGPCIVPLSGYLGSPISAAKYYSHPIGPVRAGNLTNVYQVLYVGPIQLNGKMFSVIYDSGSTLTWVPTTNCDGCYPGVNKGFTPAPGSTFSTFKVEYGLGDIGGKFAFAEVTLDKATLREFIIGVASHVNMPDFNIPEAHFDGIMGLTWPYIVDHGVWAPNIVNQLYLAGQIPANMFSLYLTVGGNGDLVQGGELVLGGLDPTHYTGDISWVPISTEIWWTTNVSSMIVHNPNGSKIAWTDTDAGVGIIAIFDAGSSIMTGPDDETFALIDLINSTVRNLTGDVAMVNYSDSGGYFYVNCSHKQYLPKVTFHVYGNGTKNSQVPMTIDGSAYVVETLANEGTDDCPLAFINCGCGNATDQPLWIFGDNFLRGFYTAYDFTNKRIGFAEAVPFAGGQMGTGNCS